MKRAREGQRDGGRESERKKERKRGMCGECETIQTNRSLIARKVSRYILFKIGMFNAFFCSPIEFEMRFFKP